MNTRGYETAKRCIDIVVGSMGLLVAAPLQLVIALLVRWKLGSPVIFRQQRPGKNEVIFDLVKFRTMREPDLRSGVASDADRMTSFGFFLRSTSLDELPTLWNVVKGDMSIVGPRPLLVQYLDRYSSEQRRRHDVRPGLTGLAQVNGRNAISWEEKFALDLQYVESRSLRMDASIVARTISFVVRRTGINAEGEATPREFTGPGETPV